MNELFGKTKIFEKEQQKYTNEANQYLGNPQKTEGLLNKAIKIANEKKGSLGEVWEKLQLFFELVKAYSKGEYKNVSPSTILTVIGTLLYFVSPLDLVPDFIIGLGILDDAALIGFTVKKISTELDAFSKWKRAFSDENPLD
ncbi:YkvA family protein [Neobacillus drentensis]|uniref:YkvA family protein n=1 Tax=Neobacillus drentensis TaxID=220684 RepID=UPI003001732A